MKLPLSDRLLACAGFVHPGDRVADIGCDHGYLGIYLLKNGIASSMIESDIHEGPLQSALRNACKYGVADKMTFHLSDGVNMIPRDFDTLVCAGMGGDTMIHILQQAPWLHNDRYRLILQCQSKSPILRQYLSDNGWYIAREAVLKDGKFLYTIMEVVWDPLSPRLTTAQTYISPALLQEKNEALGEYFQRITDGLRLAVEHQQDTQKQAILQELESTGLTYEGSELHEHSI